MSIIEVETRLCPPTYQIAFKDEIKDNGEDLSEYVIHSVDVQKTLELVADIISNAATQNENNSRTMALVCEDIVRRVGEVKGRGDLLAQTVEQYFAKDASYDFQSAWNRGPLLGLLSRLKSTDVKTEQQILPPSDSDSYSGDWDSEERKNGLLRASIYLADLYAVRIVPFFALWECIQVLVKRLARSQHVVILLTMLNRALSYKGEKPPTWFAKDVIERVRKRCEEVFPDCGKLEEEILIERFFDRIRVSTGDVANWSRPYWTEDDIETRHVVNWSEEYDIGTMLIRGKAYLENYKQMTFYDLRERVEHYDPDSEISIKENAVKVHPIVDVVEVSTNVGDIFEEDENLLGLEGMQLRRFE
ncbi:hypothetical protein MD484_g6643, partial [Candolleomyces efflorescens]